MKALFTRSVTALLCCALSLFSTTAAAQPYVFGSEPLDDVLDASAQVGRCADLTANKLTALVLSPTWWEVGDANRQNTPSPMALARYENSTLNRSDLLYYMGNVDSSAPFMRAYWHPGIGPWQLDDIGFGVEPDLGYLRFNTQPASNVVADEIARLYCGSNGDLPTTFSKWVACGNAHCEGTFNNLWQPPDTLNMPNRDSSVGRTGGVLERSCQWSGQTDTFPCYFVDSSPSQVQGYQGSFVFDPKMETLIQTTRTR